MGKVKAGEAFVTVSVDSNGLKTGLKLADKELKAFDAAAAVTVSVAVSGVKEAVRAVTDLEGRLLTLQGVTGKSAEELKGLEDKAKSLGASTSWTASQVTDGMVALARLGQSVQEVGDSIEPVMALAKGLGVSVDEAASMVGAALNQFSLSAKDSSGVADILAKATNGAAISNTELAESLKYAGTAGAGAGQSLEAVTSLIMTLRNAGLSAEQAGTSLRSLFLALQDPKKGRAFAEAFGVDLKDQDGVLRDITAILGEASGRAAQLGGNLSGVLSGIGIDTASIGAVSVLLRDAEKLPGITQGLKDSAGYSADLAKTMDSGLGGALAVAKSAADGLVLTIGDALAPSIASAAKEASRLTDNVSFLVKENKGLLVSIAAAGAKLVVFGGAVKTVKKLADVFKSGAGAVKGFTLAVDGALSSTSKKTFGGIVRPEEAAAFAEGLRKAGKSASDLVSSFANIKAKAGDVKTAEAAFVQELQDAHNMTKQEARAVSAVVKGVDSGTVSAKAFESAIKKTSGAFSKISLAVKGLAVSSGVFLAVEGAVTSAKAIYDWFNRAAEQAKAAREEVEKAAEIEKDARRASLDASGVSEQKGVISSIYEKARSFGSLSDQDKELAQKEIENARRNKTLSESDYSKLLEMIKPGARAYSSEEWTAAETIAKNNALKEGTSQAAKAAADTIKINRQAVSDKFTLDNAAWATNDIKAVKDATVKSMNKAVKDALEVSKRQDLSDTEKSAAIASIKTKTREDITGLKFRAEEGAKADKWTKPAKDWANAIEATEAALSLFAESVDAAVSSVKYAEAASLETATRAASEEGAPDTAFNFLKGSESGEASEVSDFIGTTANKFQLGLQKDDEAGAEADREAAKAAEEATKAAEERAKADREAAEAAKEAALADAEEAAEALKRSNLEDITGEQILAAVNSLESADKTGADTSNIREDLRETFGEISGKIIEASSLRSAVSSRVFTDAIGAAFATSSRTSEDYQRQQLAVLRRMSEQSGAQLDAALEILSLL